MKGKTLKMYFKEEDFEKRQEVVNALFRQHRKEIGIRDCIVYIKTFLPNKLDEFKAEYKSNPYYSKTRKFFFETYLPPVEQKDRDSFIDDIFTDPFRNAM